MNATLDVFTIHLCGACASISICFKSKRQDQSNERHEPIIKLTFQKLKLERLVSKNHRVEAVVKYRLTRPERLTPYLSTG